MPKAIWKGVVIAEAPTEAVESVEGNTYFPLNAVHQEYLRPSDSHTVCGWKGKASYFDVVIDGKINQDAAWHYPQPSEKAKHIAGHVAFWKGIRVEP